MLCVYFDSIFFGCYYGLLVIVVFGGGFIINMFLIVVFVGILFYFVYLVVKGGICLMIKLIVVYCRE